MKTIYMSDYGKEFKDKASCEKYRGDKLNYRQYLSNLILEDFCS